jgi:hypothetical protein
MFVGARAAAAAELGCSAAEGEAVTETPFRLQPGDYRLQFADFLDRLADGPVGAEEWLSFVVTHYPDEFLEEIRRQCVRLACGYGDRDQRPDTPAGREVLRLWAGQLRASRAARQPEPAAAPDRGG